MSEILAPGEIDKIIEAVISHGIGWILAFVFVSMFIENVFPPYPGDVAIFAAGFVAGSSELAVEPVLVLSILGSISSIMLVYALSRRYGRSIFESRRIRFLDSSRMRDIERWFEKWGNAVLVASRFLPGTRFLIVVTAGIGNVAAWRMALFSSISVVAWNSLVVLLAYFLHRNWEKVYEILKTYNQVALVIVIVIVGFYIVIRIRKRRRRVSRQ